MPTPNVPSELLVIAFPGEGRAAEVLQILDRMHHGHLIDLQGAAVISRNVSGKTAIHETNDFTAEQGLVGGALVGGLLGLIKGGLLEGALVGAGLGYLASKALDLGFSDDFLKEIADSLTPESSAIVAAVEFEKVDEAIRALDPYHGKILRQTLPPDQAQKLAAAMEGAPS
jgi:uncharacterized membrane protein